MHPGQDARVFEGLERDADAVAVTLRGGGDFLVARKAPPAAIGTVEAPEQRSSTRKVAQVSGPWCRRPTRFALL